MPQQGTRAEIAARIRVQEKKPLKKHLAVAALAAAAFLAQAANTELTPQQKLMGVCNKEAAGLKNDERKQKMATCLSGSKELTAQQKLMGTCSKEATGLKGDERKQKMSTCLSDGKKRQQEVMKACNAESKGKKGDEYKKAQKECLSMA